MEAEKKFNILVVEDERALVNAITKKLQSSNFETQSARTIQAALEIFKLNKFDAIWLDHYLLGKETGLDFVTILKSNELWKRIPIFVVSNTASPDKIKSYIHLGIDKYFVKSNYRLDEIIRDLRKVLVKADEVNKS